VVVALFLFCGLRGVLDTLDASIKVGSETRLVTRNRISLIFPLPLSYRDRIAGIPGVQRVAYANWFGGRDPVDPKIFYAQFAGDENYLPIYSSDFDIVQYQPPQAGAALPPGTDPKLASYIIERDACVVGERLFKRMNWKLGQKVVLSGTIFPGTWTYTIRAVYRAKNPAMGEQALFFHWKYLSEKGMGGQGQVGWYVLELSDPSQAGAVTKAVDAIYTNSAAATHTETERAFQAGFVSMYGNVPFVLRVIGLAVVFAILLVAANTMAMAIRERTSEIGVLKTLGFADGTIFGLVLTEAAVITLGGGALGALGAKFLIEGSHFNALGFLPPMSVRWSTVGAGIGVAVLIGAVSGLIPAWQASRLRIVQALRPAE
jgi:putative ABC transport system permease protein